MKIINIIGHSCSGKTTFISKLVLDLKKKGRVATIKHLGHHNFSLEKGKDTTVFYESGISISAGIDSEKTVLSIRDHNLVSILDLLADRGIDFTVIEGFKTVGLPAVVIGDLVAETVLFRNPTIDDAMNCLEKFPEYHTLKSVEKELNRGEFSQDIANPDNILKPGQSSGGVLMAVSIPAIQEKTQVFSGFQTFNSIITETSREISNEYPQVKVSVGVRNCWNFSINCEFLIAVKAEDFKTASFVISAVYDCIRKKMVIPGA
jgi:molybdopterin-guanine dinucleotide biosynthesis protein MobB